MGFKRIKQYSFLPEATLLTILLFFMPILFSYNKLATFLESGIILFLFLISILIFETYKDHFKEKLVPLLIYTFLGASILGYYDLFAGLLGFPRIFTGRTAGEPLSGFKNAGQAGAYFLIFITMLVPVRFSKLFQKLSMSNKRVLNISLFAGIIFLLLTAKIAAYVGLVSGFFLFFLWNRKFKVLLGSAVFIIIGILLFPSLKEIMPQTYDRITYKYQNRIIDNIYEGPDEFFEDNYGAAIQAFEERPLIGSGIGAFFQSYHENEVHSTYLKMLGETGLLGTLGYVIFVVSFIKLFLKANLKRSDNEYMDYLRVVTPFIIGCFVSWAYTYHFRKREFWILVAVVLIANYCARQQVLNKKLEENEVPETL
ncbi:O-antigen ligase family protein [Dokdonia sinensis]|uniref:O-antigen ligase family protein n=2 Tax=Dokdonia sinensis TaxID=2479847 RepID=A0A3M0GGN3_9FLAO|nr:O-antigen ligase family protein [Dokdonia sinensis]